METPLILEKSAIGGTMKSLCLCIVMLVALQSESFSQVPRTMTYQGIIQKEGSPFTGDGVFVFSLYHGSQVSWTSSPLTIHVVSGLFSTILGPFPDSAKLSGVDSLGIVFNGTALSPRVPLTSVLYSIYSQHSSFADSSANPGPPGQRGEKGDKGDKGEGGAAGLKGDKGEAGTPGSKGDKGDSGTAGLKGDKGEKGDGGTAGLKGDKGDSGTAGLKGDKGEKGDGGTAGLKGDKGDSGTAGLKGDKGDTGGSGLKGDKGDSGSPGIKGDSGSQGLKGDKGDTGSQGLKGDKGDKGDGSGKGSAGFDPISSTVATEGTTVFAIKATSGPSTDDARLVRTGSASAFRLEIPVNPALSASYSVQWFSGNGDGSSVEAHYGTASYGVPQQFSVGGAHRFSIMFKVGSQFAKVDLYRSSPEDGNWYGFSSNN